MARRVVNEHRLSEIHRAKTARNPVPLLRMSTSVQKTWCSGMELIVPQQFRFQRSIE
jgi:hypothetical protein